MLQVAGARGADVDVRLAELRLAEAGRLRAGGQVYHFGGFYRQLFGLCVVLLLLYRQGSHLFLASEVLIFHTSQQQPPTPSTDVTPPRTFIEQDFHNCITEHWLFINYPIWQRAKQQQNWL